MQTRQVDEVSSNCDSDYEEPEWMETLSECIITKSNKILRSLEQLEPVWILKESKGSGVLDTLRENLMMDNIDAPRQIVQTCKELIILERDMLDYELWLCAHTEDGGEALRGLEERCRAVRSSVEIKRQCLIDISKSIGTIIGNSDYTIQLETFNTVQLHDDLLREATAEFDRFVVSVGLTRGNKNNWNIKAEAVYNLQTFLRENLAVNGESFCLLNEEIVRNESERRLSDHKIYWKEHGDEDVKTISWTKLLKSRGNGYVGHLGVIAKDRGIVKTLLNNLYNKQLYQFSR